MRLCGSVKLYVDDQVAHQLVVPRGGILDEFRPNMLLTRSHPGTTRLKTRREATLDDDGFVAAGDGAADVEAKRHVRTANQVGQRLVDELKLLRVLAVVGGVLLSDDKADVLEEIRCEVGLNQRSRVTSKHYTISMDPEPSRPSLGSSTNGGYFPGERRGGRGTRYFGKNGFFAQATM